MITVPQEWVVLAQKLENDPAIKKRWDSPETLYRTHLSNKTFVSSVNIGGVVAITAFGALWETSDPSIWELGTIWKDSKNRARAVSLEIIVGLQTLIPKGISVFLVTSHEKVIEAVRALEWQHIPEWQHSPCSNVIDPSRNMGEGRQIYFLQSTS